MTDRPEPEPSEPSTSSNGARAPWGRRGGVLLLVVLCSGYFVLLSSWSLAMPNMTAADEGEHVIKAVALERGEWIGVPVRGEGGTVTKVRVPDLYVRGLAASGCFLGDELQSAKCAHLPGSNGHLETFTIGVGRYPPLYYAIVGLPTVFSTSWAAVSVMRLISAGMNALFLGLAAFSIVAWTRSRLLLIGLLVAGTPTVLYYAAVVNPSGIEISSAICLWCSSIVLLCHRRRDPPPGLIVIVTIAACVLTTTRGLSPLWTVLIAVFVVWAAGPRRCWQLIRHHRGVAIAAGVVVLAALAACAWIVGAHALDQRTIPQSPLPPGSGPSAIVRGSFGLVMGYAQGYIEAVGSFDVPTPAYALVAWVLAVGSLFMGAIAASRFRRSVILLAVVALVVVAPIAIGYHEVIRSGYIWQSRYTLPLAVGVPILATSLIDEVRPPAWLVRRGATAVLVLLASAEVVAFWFVLRRYAVGSAGPLDFLRTGWQPPVGDVVAVLWNLVGVGLVCGLAYVGLPGARPSPPTHRRRRYRGAAEPTRIEAGDREDLPG